MNRNDEEGNEDEEEGRRVRDTLATMIQFNSLVMR